MLSWAPAAIATARSSARGRPPEVAISGARLPSNAVVLVGDWPGATAREVIQAVETALSGDGRVLAVTDDLGVVRGVLSDLDALRAMAERRLG